MIFATVGTQLPFPRMIDALNALAPELGEEIIAQIGTDPEARTRARWPNLDLRGHLSPAEFGALFRSARLVVAHAGIGTILSAKRWQKPLVLLPRRHDMGEHRNDHQLATARQVSSLPGLHVAWEVGDLSALLARTDLEPTGERPSQSYQSLIGRLREEIGLS